MLGQPSHLGSPLLGRESFDTCFKNLKKYINLPMGIVGLCYFRVLFGGWGVPGRAREG